MSCSSRPVQNLDGSFWLTATPFAKAAEEDRRALAMPPNGASLTLQSNAVLLSIPLSRPIDFCYATPSFSHYLRHYKSEGWCGRKVSALPYALLGMIRCIFHFVRSFFNFLKAHAALWLDVDATAFEAKRAYRISCWAADVFNVVRDLEEVAGNLLRLFHDKTGSYLVGDSLYHKEMYHYRLQKIKV